VRRHAACSMLVACRVAGLALVCHRLSHLVRGVRTGALKGNGLQSLCSGLEQHHGRAFGTALCPIP
jgi:hypothetical protein